MHLFAIEIKPKKEKKEKKKNTNPRWDCSHIYHTSLTPTSIHNANCNSHQPRPHLFSLVSHNLTHMSSALQDLHLHDSQQGVWLPYLSQSSVSWRKLLSRVREEVGRRKIECKSEWRKGRCRALPCTWENKSLDEPWGRDRCALAYTIVQEERLSRQVTSD